MKTIIIILNFLLITLIVYSFLNSKVVEYFSGCPSGQNNEVTKQSSQLSQNESQLAKLEAKYRQLYLLSLTQNSRINANKDRSKSLASGVTDEKNKKMKELNKLEGEFDSGGGGAPANIGGGMDSMNKLGKIMEKSPSMS